MKKRSCRGGVCMLFAALVLCAVTAGAVTVTPINVAEAVLEPFWDPALSGFAHWRIDPDGAPGLAVRQNWCAVDYEWTAAPSDGPALRMWRDFYVPCAEYDRLIVNMVAPEGARVRLTAATDAGTRQFESSALTSERYEHVLELEGARMVHRITIEVFAGGDGPAGGWLRWIALQNSAWLDRHLDQWRHWDQEWPPYLQSADFEPSFHAKYGIFVTVAELEALRREHEQESAAQGASRFTRIAEAACAWEPEAAISEFAMSGGGKNGMFDRERDETMPSLPDGTDAALAGLVLRDARVLRVAARCALSLAACDQWDYGFVCKLRGGAFEARPFRRSYCSEDVAYILDLAGEMFTDAGRAFLMRRLAEEGVAPINYTAWKHEYIFHCNQLAYFNMGRMCAYLVLEREWPRVRPYTELALQDTIENLNNAILPDGGYVEGPTYFGATARRNYEILRLYARARNDDPARLVPGAVKRTSDYAALVMSTADRDVIPICDSGDTLSYETLDALIAMAPDSHWAALRDRKRAREDGLSLSPSLPPFVRLPELGAIASHRQLGDATVKLLILGNHANADHTHEDKGSFVLEFAGEAFAEDLGICEYEDPMHQQYKQCQRHNMLVPIGCPGRACPVRPIPVDITPTGEGDTGSFHAQIDATPGWEAYYRRWVRTWDSSRPERLTIYDAYELLQGEGVEFYWQTLLPCRIEGQQAVIEGTRGVITLAAPPDCELRVETLPLSEGATQNRIAVRRMGMSGELVMRVSLRLRATTAS